MKTVSSLLMYPRTTLTSVAIIIFVLTTYTYAAYKESTLALNTTHLLTVFTPQVACTFIGSILLMIAAASLVMAIANAKIANGAYSVDTIDPLLSPSGRTAVIRTTKLFKVFPWQQEMVVANVIDVTETSIEHYSVIFHKSTPLPSGWEMARGVKIG